MARPKTKGDSIQFRLPLEVDAKLRAEAEREGLTLSQWVEGKVLALAGRIGAGK